MIRASDLKDGLDVHLHPAVAGKELAAEALWDAVRRVLRRKNISCLILSFFPSLFVYLSLSLYFKPSSGALKMHCSKEISSFSILFLRRGLGPACCRASLQGKCEVFLGSLARWLTTRCTTCCSRCRIAHGGAPCP